jgi:hypothetical protein
MGIENSNLLAGATVSATGGTAFTLTTDGMAVPNGKHLINAAVADMRVRPNATAKTKMSKVQANGEWTKGRRSVTYCVPKLLTTGKTVFPLIRIEVEDHPEMTQAETDALCNIGAQLLFDADWLAFWHTGSLS